uniref:Small integral membrane protein 19 n=1 Tax=Astatotilapia calliptera TaxID=8154 RepID=A0AAX7TLL1_ASTCA
MGAHGVLGNEPDSIDYSVHEAWNEATNVYLLVILVSFGLLMYARKNKRKIMRIFTLPPTAGSSPEPNFYDSLQKVRLRQQLEMYSLGSLSSSSSNNISRASQTVCSSPWSESPSSSFSCPWI